MFIPRHRRTRILNSKPVALRAILGFTHRMESRYKISSQHCMRILPVPNSCFMQDTTCTGQDNTPPSPPPRRWKVEASQLKATFWRPAFFFLSNFPRFVSSRLGLGFCSRPTADGATQHNPQGPTDFNLECTPPPSPLSPPGLPGLTPCGVHVKKAVIR